MQDTASGGAPSRAQGRIGVVVIHGVGEADTGWINSYIVDELEKRSALDFEDFSELYLLPDRGRTDKDLNFQALVRRASYRSGAEIAFAELRWADLAKIGRGPFTHIWSLLKTFFEAPTVMATAMLRQSRRGLGHVLRFLIQLIIWLFKWPIVGVTFAGFACGFALVLVNLFLADQASGRSGLEVLRDWLPYKAFAIETVVLPVLAVLIFGGLFLASRRLYKDIWLTDLSFSTAAASFVAVNFIVLNMKFHIVELTTLDHYFHVTLQTIRWIWQAWSAAVIAALILMGFAYLRGLFSGWKDHQPLHRPAAALWLAIVQSVGWNLVIPATAVLLSLVLVACPQHNCALETDQRELLGAVWFSLLGIVLVGLVLAVIFSARREAAKRYRNDLPQAAAKMDRVIIGPLLIFIVIIAMTFDILATAFDVKDKLIADYLLNATSTSIIAFLILLLYGFNKLTGEADGILHISRDIIDHEYAPKPGMLRFLPQVHGRMAIRPRRRRIHERLAVLIETIIAREKVDKLLFLTHSQGTVIMYDYLRQREPDPVLDPIGEIHILTLGSPLTHLYQYYFEEYGHDHRSHTGLRGNVTSWINMWRVDDPIGNAVDIIRDNFIVNVPLPAGGHRDYWKENEVASAILHLLGVPETATPAPSPEAQSQQPPLLRGLNRPSAPAPDLQAPGGGSGTPQHPPPSLEPRQNRPSI